MEKVLKQGVTAEETVIFGFGAQGKAQALNLRDSNMSVSVCIRKDSPRKEAVKRAEIALMLDPIEAAQKAQCAALLIPDSEQPAFYTNILHKHLPEGSALIFAHGFAVHYKRIAPRDDLDVILVAPLSHADALRKDFVEHSRVPCVIAVAQDATGRAHDRAMSYAKAIAKDGPFIQSSFAEEVETDLFAEQAVLCGGMPELVRASYETLVENGYSEDIAYISCLKELRAITELLWHNSIAGMRKNISDTAQYGSVTRGPRVIDEHVKAELRKMLCEIRSGKFAQELFEDQEKGFPTLKEAMKQDERHAIERVHEKNKKRN
ncbi:MAG: ketol-acid reductoisomerase [Pseudomonadota bacterium]